MGYAYASLPLNSAVVINAAIGEGFACMGIAFLEMDTLLSILLGVPVYFVAGPLEVAVWCCPGF